MMLQRMRLTENQSARFEIPRKLALLLELSHCDEVNRFVMTVV